MIKEECIPQDWKTRPTQHRQKNRDVRWTVKFKKAKEKADVDMTIPIYGYQKHVSIDASFGFILKWQATDAALYEGAVLPKGLLDKTNTAKGMR